VSSLFDLTPILQTRVNPTLQWSIARGPVMFVDEPISYLALEQEDPAHDGDLKITLANSLQEATLDSPIRRLNLRPGDAVALVGIKHRPLIVVSGLEGTRTRLCVPIYSYRVKSSLKEADVVRLTDVSYFPIPASPPILDAGYARLDRLTVVPESLLTPTSLEVEPDVARKVLEAMLFAQMTGRLPAYIDELRQDFH
jgi:hypothetical protein